MRHVVNLVSRDSLLRLLSQCVKGGRLQSLHEAPDSCLHASLQGCLRAAHLPGLAIHDHLAVTNLHSRSTCLLPVNLTGG